MLPFDTEAAAQAVMLAADWQHAGRAVDSRDGQIAGVAQARQTAAATRNVRHFWGGGLTVAVVTPSG